MSPVIPAYLTVNPLTLLTRPSGEWQSWFPFSSPRGLWTYVGRTALYRGLLRLKLKPGSTVLFPSYFQGVEADTLLHAGFKLRFYRVDRSFRPDLTDVERRLDGEASALYITHYFGLPQPLPLISEFCRTKGLKLIEDCALGLFSKDGESWLGSAGDMAMYCVYKTVPLPHGGFLVTKTASGEEKMERPPARPVFLQTADLIAQHFKNRLFSPALEGAWLRTAGLRKALVGEMSSGNMDFKTAVLEYGAAPVAEYLMGFCNPQTIIQRRRENFERLLCRLDGAVRPVIKELPGGACPCFFPVYVEDKAQFRKDLAARGIGSVNLWNPPHRACPEDMAKEVAPWRNQILELPIHQQIDEEGVERIAAAVAEVANRKRQSVSMWSIPEMAFPTTSGH